MRDALRGTLATLLGLVLVVQIGGCPLTGSDYYAGGTGNPSKVRSTASVEVLTPATDLSITGGTPIEVNWQAYATSAFAVMDVVFDADQDPTNDNEEVAFENLALDESTALADTTYLARGTYFVGVVLKEVGEVVAYGYAPGVVIVDQRPELSFTSDDARRNLSFDRTEGIVPTFDVSWTVTDPDSPKTVQIYLDSDELANGNEILLYTASTIGADVGIGRGEFSFDLPTAAFEAGTYRLLALVSDGQNSFEFYAPGSITLRARLAGNIDLRDLPTSESAVSGAVFEGFNPRDNAGSLVASGKDIDADGFNDFLIVSQFGKSRYQVNSQRTGVGESYLVYGRSGRFSGTISLNSTGTLFRGEIFTGAPEVSDPVRPSRGISSFTLLSDWDRDGVREMAFGLPFTDSLSIGGYALSSAGINLAPLDPNGYFRSGAVVVVAGSCLRPDLGFPGRNVFNLAEFGTLGHLPITCRTCLTDNPCPCREGFIGPKAPTPANSVIGSVLRTCGCTYFHQHVVSVGGLNEGTVRLGCRFSSAEYADQFGEHVSSWDFDSIIMSAPNREPATSVLAATAGSGGGVISIFYNDVKDGFYPWTQGGQSVPSNDDLGYPGPAESAGLSLLPHGGPYHYVMDDIVWSPGYYVDPDDAEACVQTTDAHLATPDRSVRLWSELPAAYLSNVEGIGDVNGDGLRDLTVGVPLTDSGAGACYLVLGRLRDLVWGGELRLEELGLPMNSSDSDGQRVFDGIRIVGTTGSRLGQSQATAGDFNNDGLADVIIGSPYVNNRRGGAAVFFGSRDVINLTEAEIPFDEIASRGLGVIFVGDEPGDLAGARVASAGDVDGDGNTDVLIAAPNRSVRLDVDYDGTIEIDRTECGVVYLVYGSPELATREGRTGEPGVLYLADIGADPEKGGVPGAVFIGRNSGDFLGGGLGLQGDRSTGIAGLGDVDGDGAGDLMFSSVSASPRDRASAGEAYLIYGTSD